ncbi:MAG: response regulator [Planctomycetes bacterium]|nr:response regulator [Planctomycetota bacterium]
MNVFDLRATLDAVAVQGRSEIRGVPVTLDVRREPDVPRHVRGDGDRLRLMLNLLVGHAVSVTPAGRIVLRVQCLADEPSAVRLRFEVHDGDPESAQRRLDDVSDEAHLDLVLWQQLVPAMADSWGVDGSSEGGSVHWFDVTLDTEAEPDSVESDDMMTVPQCARVLVVEDNLVNQKVAEQLIKRLGYDVDVVGDGQQAVERLESESYGLILMDCQMPVMDGYEATVEIRRREGDRRHTPIVALTAHALTTNRDRCMEIGMDDFVTKPVTSDALRRVIESWIPRSGSPASC